MLKGGYTLTFEKGGYNLNLLTRRGVKIFQKAMKIEYEYETGWLKGKNEAIMEHSRIIQNRHNLLNTKLQQVKLKKKPFYLKKFLASRTRTQIEIAAF